MKHVASLGLVTMMLLGGCADAELEDDAVALGSSEHGVSASDAVGGISARLVPFGGDPGGTDLYLALSVDDARLRELAPEFDGLEHVYAFVPDVAPIELRYRDTVDGKDRYVSERTLNPFSYEYERVVEHGITFALATNVGWFDNVAHRFATRTW